MTSGKINTRETMDTRTRKNLHEAQKQVMEDLGFDDEHARFDAWLTSMPTRAIWKDFNNGFLARHDIPKKYKGTLINPVVLRVKEDLRRSREGSDTASLSTASQDRKIWKKEDHYVHFCTQLVLGNQNLFYGRGLSDGSICEIAFRVLQFFVSEAHPSRINASETIRLLNGQNSLEYRDEGYRSHPSSNTIKSPSKITCAISTSLHHGLCATSPASVDSAGSEEQWFAAKEHLESGHDEDGKKKKPNEERCNPLERVSDEDDGQRGNLENSSSMQASQPPPNIAGLEHTLENMNMPGSSILRGASPAPPPPPYVPALVSSPVTMQTTDRSRRGNRSSVWDPDAECWVNNASTFGF